MKKKILMVFLAIALWVCLGVHTEEDAGLLHLNWNQAKKEKKIMGEKAFPTNGPNNVPLLKTVFHIEFSVRRCFSKACTLGDTWFPGPVGV